MSHDLDTTLDAISERCRTLMESVPSPSSLSLQRQSLRHQQSKNAHLNMLLHSLDAPSDVVVLSATPQIGGGYLDGTYFESRSGAGPGRNSRQQAPNMNHFPSATQYLRNAQTGHLLSSYGSPYAVSNILPPTSSAAPRRTISAPDFNRSPLDSAPQHSRVRKSPARFEVQEDPLRPPVYAMPHHPSLSQYLARVQTELESTVNYASGSDRRSKERLSVEPSLDDFVSAPPINMNRISGYRNDLSHHAPLTVDAEAQPRSIHSPHVAPGQETVYHSDAPRYELERASPTSSISHTSIDRVERSPTPEATPRSPVAPPRTLVVVKSPFMDSVTPNSNPPTRTEISVQTEEVRESPLTKSVSQHRGDIKEAGTMTASDAPKTLRSTSVGTDASPVAMTGPPIRQRRDPVQSTSLPTSFGVNYRHGTSNRVIPPTEFRALLLSDWGPSLVSPPLQTSRPPAQLGPAVPNIHIFTDKDFPTPPSAAPGKVRNPSKCC